jgi:hypothetical protein
MIIASLCSSSGSQMVRIGNERIYDNLSMFTYKDFESPTINPQCMHYHTQQHHIQR